MSFKDSTGRPRFSCSLLLFDAAILCRAISVVGTFVSTLVETCFQRSRPATCDRCCRRARRWGAHQAATGKPLGRIARQPVPTGPSGLLEDLNLGTLALTNDFHPSERSDPLFSVGKWTKDCQLACENSTLHAFVNGRRNGANKSFCLGVVLVEPPATRTSTQQCLTAVQHSRTGVLTGHSRCYQQVEGMLPV